MTAPHSHMDNDNPVIDILTVPEAAKRLGVTQSAVHKRIARGQIQWEKTADGRTLVFLGHKDMTGRGNDGPNDRVNDRSKDELVQSLRDQIGAYRDQVEYLRAELARRSEEHSEEMRRKDHLLAAALERIPAIEAPQATPSDERERPTTPSEPRSDARAPQEEKERRSWWRRFFGV